MRRRATCDFGGNELRASPHRCTVIALPRLSPETRVQPLKHVADSPCYTTQGGWAEGGGCIHGAVTSVRLCCFSEGSFCLEGAWLFGPILRMCAPQRREESRKWHIHKPPSVTASPLSWDPSYGGGGGVSCDHANSPRYPLKTWGSQLRGMREREMPKKRVSLTALCLFIILPYSVFNCELAWQ